MSLELNLAGATVATTKFTHSISEFFPTSNRSYAVESSISNSTFRDYLPVNASITDGAINGSNAEFNLNAANQEFIDTSSFAVETKIIITKKMEGSFRQV